VGCYSNAVVAVEGWGTGKFKRLQNWNASRRGLRNTQKSLLQRTRYWFNINGEGALLEQEADGCEVSAIA
jgi:hypothetical protein